MNDSYESAFTMRNGQLRRLHRRPPHRMRALALMAALLACLDGGFAAGEAPERLPGLDRELSVVGSFNDYNEVFRGTAVRDPRGWSDVTLRGEVTGIECTGKSVLVYDPKTPDCAGGEAIGRLQCTDGRIVQLETRTTSCSRAVSTGYDQFGHKLTFLAGLSSEFTGELAKAELEAAAKRPALPRFAPDETRTARGYVTGTGFFVSDRGHLITNNRLVEGAASVAVVIDGTEVPARVVAGDKKRDIAVLKIERGTTALPLLAKHGVAVGTKVSTVGYPLVAIEQQRQQTTHGTVTATDDVIGDDRFLQMDLAVQAGSCGAPLFGPDGAVVGVVTAPISPVAASQGRGFSGQNVGYALKSEHAVALLKESDIALPKTGKEGDAAASIVLVVAH